jgi:hypothetical protein
LIDPKDRTDLLNGFIAVYESVIGHERAFSGGHGKFALGGKADIGRPSASIYEHISWPIHRLETLPG